jgi:lysophospholipase L1-like esterase
MKKIAIIISLTFLWLSCDKKDNAASQVIIPPVSNMAKKYLALGDSYTIGQGVLATDRFPAQTKKWLVDNGVSMEEPQIIAVSGWTTENLQGAISTQNPVGPYDLVSLLIGVNDQYQRRDTTGYRDKFLQLLNKSIQLAGSRRDHVFVLSIPDYSITPFAQYLDTTLIRVQIDQFNAINKEVTFQNGCQYLDITPSTREAANDPTLITADGLHPSAKEYRKWTDRLGPMMRTVLR